MRDLFDEMERMQRMFERAFNEGYSSQALVTPSKSCTTNQCVPARSALANIKQTEMDVEASFEMPGVDKKDIKINVTDKAIEVKAFKSDVKDIESNDKSTEKSAKSCRSIKFYRRMALPAQVDPEKTKARCENGILRVTMPKAEIAKRKEIAIE
mgnify:CR=1 FL=1|tara:strand:+ start:1958 stop:2419 length:462 start_codon:yes stop_codon:yes gene_type:complete